MKIVLTILCGLMILLSGGCVISVGGGMDAIGLINLAVIVPNALLIAAMYGYSGPMRPVFIGLAITDIVIALVLGGLTVSLAGPDLQVLWLGLLITFAFLLKGGLTWSMSNKLKQRAGATPNTSKDT